MSRRRRFGTFQLHEARGIPEAAVASSAMAMKALDMPAARAPKPTGHKGVGRDRSIAAERARALRAGVVHCSAEQECQQQRVPSCFTW